MTVPTTAEDRAAAAFRASMAAMKPVARRRLRAQIERAVKAGREANRAEDGKRSSKPVPKPAKKARRKKAGPARDWTGPLW